MVTINDVAKKAKVSIATVSRVFNNTAKVAESTRKKILKTAKDLGYKHIPNSRIRSSFKTIGLITPTFRGNHYGEIFMGIEDCAFKNGYDIIVATTQRIPEKEERVIEDYFKRKVDGVLICSLKGNEYFLNELINSGIPVVSIDNKISDIKVDSINIDNYNAAYEISKYLYRKGHRKIFFIPGPNDYYSSRERKDGLYNFCLKHRDFKVIESEMEGFEPLNGYRAMKNHLEKYEKNFTAIFSINDHVAMGAMKALSENNIKIPDDVSIIGFDNSLFAECTVPPLTTVFQPRNEMGFTAAQLLIERLNGNKTGVHRNILLPTDLIERDSVKDISKSKVRCENVLQRD
jgi:LacI family transcriptional regulator